MEHRSNPPVPMESGATLPDAALSEDFLASIPTVCFGMIGRAASRAVTRVLAVHLAPLDLQPTQFPILVMIRLHRDDGIAALAARLELDASALTRNVQLLERKGFLTARGGRGRGGKSLALSAAGEEILVKAVAKWRLAQEALLAELGDEEAKILRSLLKRLEEAAGRAEHKVKV
ncbi:MAG: MarR family winged helix-turn-helix transcriptional regulator [Bradyrhizobium sp.]|nr:MarR family winged helix-turn-helix transcriptional regulator [Bradyrhizobium sp.]